MIPLSCIRRLSTASGIISKRNGTQIASNAAWRRCFANVADDANLPLKGIKVLDMTRVLAGVSLLVTIRPPLPILNGHIALLYSNSGRFRVGCSWNNSWSTC